MMNDRTEEQIKSLLHLAKLDDLHSFGVCQVLNFVPSLDSSQYRIFEMPAPILNKMTTSGSQASIELKDEFKTEHNGHVFAITPDQTFSVVEAETSNTLLFASDWWLPSSKNPTGNKIQNMPIQLIKSNYFEFKPCVSPSLRILKQMLLSTTYYGPIEDDIYLDDKNKDKLYTLKSIEDRLPCSSTDLVNSFRRLRICEFNGYIRLLDCDYLTQMIRDLFALADENAWDWRNYGFPLQESIDGLSCTHDVGVLKKAIGLFFAQRFGHNYSDSQEVYIYPCTSKICQVIGEHLLAVTNSFDLEDFLSLWKASIPNGLRPRLRGHLTCFGRAFIQSTISSNDNDALNLNSLRFKSISLLRSEDLPDDTIENRFKALFQRCSSWLEPELASYIGELIPLDQADRSSAVNTKRIRLRDNSWIDISFVDHELCDFDFDYEDISLDKNSDEISYLVDDNNSHPVPSRVSVVLNRFCRVSTCSFGRVFTSRH